MAAVSGFWGCDNIGISSLGAVLHGRTIKSFQELQNEFNMPQTQFYKYLKFRHGLTPYIKDFKTLPEFNPLEGKLFMGELGDHKITKIYQTLITNSYTTLATLRETWYTDIGSIEDDDWTEALESPRSAAISSCLRFIQFKYLHCAYYTRQTMTGWPIAFLLYVCATILRKAPFYTWHGLGERLLGSGEGFYHVYLISWLGTSLCHRNWISYTLQMKMGAIDTSGLSNSWASPWQKGT